MYVGLRQTLEECLAIMSAAQVHQLPVLDESLKPRGIIKMQDIAAILVENKEFLIRELTRYISGSVAVTGLETAPLPTPQKVTFQ